MEKLRKVRPGVTSIIHAGTSQFEAFLRSMLRRVDECFVVEERVQMQPVAFYGGRVASNLDFLAPKVAGFRSC